MLNFLAVGIGGFLGTTIRYLITLIPMEPENGFPIKTLFINVAGSLIIGLIVSMSVKNNWDSRIILFLKIGICAGFTTFSSFALETEQMLVRGQTLAAVLYAVLSIVLGVTAVFTAQYFWD